MRIDNSGKIEVGQAINVKRRVENSHDLSLATVNMQPLVRPRLASSHNGNCFDRKC